jgi:hypothetical protein
MRKCRAANESLRETNKRLEEELGDAKRTLDNIKHLQCNICRDSFKSVVTRCGHGYCAECLSSWLQRQKNGKNDGEDDGDLRHTTVTVAAEAAEEDCPVCRRVVRDQEDV